MLAYKYNLLGHVASNDITYIRHDKGLITADIAMTKDQLIIVNNYDRQSIAE